MSAKAARLRECHGCGEQFPAGELSTIESCCEECLRELASWLEMSLQDLLARKARQAERAASAAGAS